jgi:hypothetical protein
MAPCDAAPWGVAPVSLGSAFCLLEFGGIKGGERAGVDGASRSGHRCLDSWRALPTPQSTGPPQPPFSYLLLDSSPPPKF